MTNKRWYINIRFWPDMRKVCIYFAFIVWSQYERRYYFIPPRFGFMVTFHWGFSSCRSTVDSIIRQWRKEVVKYLTCKLARWIALRSATRLITLIQSLFTYIQSGCKSRKKQSEGCVFWSSRLYVSSLNWATVSSSEWFLRLGSLVHHKSVDFSDLPALNYILLVSPVDSAPN